MRLIALLVLIVLSSGCVVNPDRTGIKAHLKLSIAEVSFLPEIDLGLDISTSRGVTENASVKKSDVIGRDWGFLRLRYC